MKNYDEMAENDPIEILSFIYRSSVIPENSGTYDVVIFVKHNKTVHLTAKAYARDLTLITFSRKLIDSVNRICKPIGRVLLRPTVMGKAQRV